MGEGKFTEEPLEESIAAVVEAERPVIEPRFVLDYESSTGQIMFDATYPGGHHHRTSMSRATLATMIESARVAYRKSAA